MKLCLSLHVCASASVCMCMWCVDNRQATMVKLLAKIVDVLYTLERGKGKVCTLILSYTEVFSQL